MIGKNSFEQDLSKRSRVWKNHLFLQMDLDEDKIMSSSNASYEGFVSKGRADFLLQHLLR